MSNKDLNNNMIRSTQRWAEKLNDNELVDIVHCITAAFRMSETKGASITLASMAIGIEKTIKKRFDDNAINSILGSAISFGEKIKTAIIAILKNENFINDMNEKFGKAHDCNRCDQQNDCSIKDDIQKQKDIDKLNIQ